MMEAKTEMNVRRLPSVDWIAFGMGAAVLLVNYLWPRLTIVLTICVFLPSLLREIGWLKDSDEYTLDIMRRAGFHGLMAVVGVFVLDYILYRTGAHAASTMGASLFNGEFLHKVVVGVFLFSYLVQYWGARLGVVRVFLGAAILNLAPMTYYLVKSPDADFRLYGSIVSLALAICMVALALIVRVRPRLGARVMLVVALVAGILILWPARDPRLLVGCLAAFLQVALLLGGSGWVLLRDTSVASME